LVVVGLLVLVKKARLILGSQHAQHIAATYARLFNDLIWAIGRT
jgi:hypothetical protein